MTAIARGRVAAAAMGEARLRAGIRFDDDLGADHIPAFLADKLRTDPVVPAAPEPAGSGTWLNSSRTRAYSPKTKNPRQDGVARARTPSTLGRLLFIVNVDRAAVGFDLFAQLVALAAGRFQIEEQVLHLELQLIDRVLGDANQSVLQTGEMADAVANRYQVVAHRERQLIQVIAKFDQIAGELLILAPFQREGLGHWCLHEPVLGGSSTNRRSTCRADYPAFMSTFPGRRRSGLLKTCGV